MTVFKRTEVAETSWNNNRYEDVKRQTEISFSKGLRTSDELLREYQNMIIAEDYEAAKAITEVLALRGIKTVTMHPYIKELN